mgnify:CR=1 FL=1
MNDIPDFICRSFQDFGFGTKRYAHIILPVLSENESRSYEHPCLIQDLVRKALATRVKRLRHLAPQEHSSGIMIIFHTQHIENLPDVDWESNFYGIIDRTFSVMNQHNSRLMVELCKPDILVQMPFDSYGEMSDYALAAEINRK